METMATSTTTGFYMEASSQAAIVAQRARTLRRRNITPRAGHALEILGHAIEYLADEIVHEGISLPADKGRVTAVQLLMALNRQVYFECPEAHTFSERCRSLLHL
jgi:hypothetical protein